MVLAIICAASSSSSKKTTPTPAAKTPTHARARTTTALGWRTQSDRRLDTQAQVIAAGDAICRTMNSRLAPLLTKAGKALSTASGELRSLAAPTSSIPTLERLTEALNATDATYFEEAAELSTGDMQTVKADEHAILHTAAMAHGFAIRDGLHDCSN